MCFRADLFIAGSAVQASSPPSPWQMLTLRFGKQGSDWGFKWHTLYGSQGDAHANDIGVVRGPTTGGPGTMSAPDTYIFVAGRSERQIGTNPPVFTNDFTTLCYKETGTGVLSLHWDARLQEQNGQDVAWRLLAASESTPGDGNAVAIVAGVTEDTNGQWNWQVVKYDDVQPPDPQVPKVPVWSITFPFHYSSAGDDVPAAITAVPTVGGWGLHKFWLTGTAFHSPHGQGMATVQYEQVP
jgi:hypothetical protein